ncbi:MAG: galactose-1-phosphate uridylyltransferase [Planctomycetia bacterium]
MSDSTEPPAAEDSPLFRRRLSGDEWVLVAPERRRRPNADASLVPEPCPFCAGAESETPPEIDAVRSPDSNPNEPGWSIRVVPNRYPALRPSPNAEPFDPAQDRSPAVGRHEVFIEGPDHTESLADQPPTAAGLLMDMLRKRLQFLADDPAVAYAQFFKNKGSAAGASQSHSHSQLLALPFVPALMQAEYDAARRAADDGFGCPLCRELASARRDGRLVAERDGFIAFCPSAPRFAYEFWIAPVEHHSRFAASCDPLKLGRLVWEMLRRLEAVLPHAPYNLFLRDEPLHRPHPAFHWRFEATPRRGGLAGFELATGVYVLSVTPEKAAAELRAASA